MTESRRGIHGHGNHDFGHVVDGFAVLHEQVTFPPDYCSTHGTSGLHRRVHCGCIDLQPEDLNSSDMPLTRTSRRNVGTEFEVEMMTVHGILEMSGMMPVGCATGLFAYVWK